MNICISRKIYQRDTRLLVQITNLINNSPEYYVFDDITHHKIYKSTIGDQVKYEFNFYITGPAKETFQSLNANAEFDGWVKKDQLLTNAETKKLLRSYTLKNLTTKQRDELYVGKRIYKIDLAQQIRIPKHIELKYDNFLVGNDDAPVTPMMMGKKLIRFLPSK